MNEREVGENFARLTNDGDTREIELCSDTAGSHRVDEANQLPAILGVPRRIDAGRHRDRNAGRREGLGRG